MKCSLSLVMLNFSGTSSAQPRHMLRGGFRVPFGTLAARLLRVTSSWVFDSFQVSWVVRFERHRLRMPLLV